MIIKSRTFARCNEESSHLALMTTPASRALATALDQALNTTFWQTCSVYVCVCVFVCWLAACECEHGRPTSCVYICVGREGGRGRQRERECVCLCDVLSNFTPHSKIIGAIFIQTVICRQSTQRKSYTYLSRPSYAGNRRKRNPTHIHPDRHMEVIDAKEILHTFIQTAICR
jgi:hypothetical protein